MDTRLITLNEVFDRIEDIFDDGDISLCSGETFIMTLTLLPTEFDGKWIRADTPWVVEWTMVCDTTSHTFLSELTFEFCGKSIPNQIEDIVLRPWLIMLAPFVDDQVMREAAIIIAAENM